LPLPVRGLAVSSAIKDVTALSAEVAVALVGNTLE
jgi:hypothetical protein